MPARCLEIVNHNQGILRGAESPKAMNQFAPPKARYVIGHDGRRLALADLPLPGTKRWVIRRKAEVVAAVRGGLVSQEEACSRYALSIEELLSWQQCIDQYGLRGLRANHVRFYPKVPQNCAN
jgi:hypothetical protein